MKVTPLIVGSYQVNCLIIETENKNAVIIDPGSDVEKISNYLSAHGLTPKIVLLTHGHFDHVSALFELKKKYDLVVYASEFEEDLLTRKDLFFCNSSPVAEYALCKFTPIEDFVKLSDNDEVKLDDLTFTFVHTPGHTKGSGVYLLEDKMFSGDTLFSGNCGRCDLYGGDYKTMLNSLEKLAQLEGDYQVYPGHGGFTNLERERQINPYMRNEDYDDYI